MGNFLSSMAQSSLTGTLTDNQTGEPIPYANIFFAHTTLGTSSLTDGTFSLSRIPNGKYDLVIEVVGYAHYKQPMEFQDQAYRLDIALNQDTVELPPITVVADQADKRYYPVFVRFFVGDAANAKECEILNRDVLHFYFDSRRNYLTVTARSPVQVINRALGYKVHYTLERFGLDFGTGVKVMEGSPRFELLPAKRRKDSVAWEKKRDKAYKGSLFHFMRALYANQLAREGFDLYIADSTQSPPSSETLKPFDADKLVTGDKIRRLNFEGSLKLEYREKQDWEYPGRGYGPYREGYQQTYLKLNQPTLDIYENGYYADQLSVYLNGYLMWRETVCNMVPLGHELKRKKKKKG